MLAPTRELVADLNPAARLFDVLRCCTDLGCAPRARVRNAIPPENGVAVGASFHWHLIDVGVDHVKIKPRTRRLAEAFVGCLTGEGAVPDDLQQNLHQPAAT